MWGNEQKAVSLVVENAVGDRLSGRLPVQTYRRDVEIVYGWLIAGLGLNSLAVHKLPCAVGIIVERELFLHPVFPQNESGLKLRLLCSRGHLHPFFEVGSDVIGAEVEHW